MSESLTQEEQAAIGNAAASAVAKLHELGASGVIVLLCHNDENGIQQILSAEEGSQLEVDGLVRKYIKDQDMFDLAESVRYLMD